MTRIVIEVDDAGVEGSRSYLERVVVPKLDRVMFETGGDGILLGRRFTTRLEPADQEEERR